MKSLLIMCVLAFGWVAQAQDVGVVVGLRSDSADAETTGDSITGKSSFQAGAIAKFDLKDAWGIRTGFIYAQRAYEYKAAAGGSTDLKFTYFEVPVGLMYKFSDYGGAFLGPAIAFNVSKDCGSGTCEGTNSAPMGLQLGASFKFAPQLGAEFYFETGFSKIADGVKSPKAVMANLLITFD
jgi:hypothetical protein